MIHPILLSACLFISALPACAGAGADRMGACLVAMTSGNERLILGRWIIFSMAAHPSVSEVLVVPDGLVESNQQDFADLVTDLLANRCVEETRAAFREEGGKSFETAFGELGRAAVQEAMLNRAVSDRMMGFASKLNEAALMGAITK